MLQDLAALAPPVIVCVAFLVGVGVLLRRELAPKRRARAQADRPANASQTRRTQTANHTETMRIRGDRSET